MLNSGHHCTSHCSTFYCVSTFHFWSQCSVHSSIYFILSSPLVHLVCLSRLPSHRMFECCCLLLKKVSYFLSVLLFPPLSFLPSFLLLLTPFSLYLLLLLYRSSVNSRLRHTTLLLSVVFPLVLHAPFN